MAAGVHSLIGMRTNLWLAMALVSAHPTLASTSAVVFPVQITRAGTTTVGACTLIHREDRDRGIRLYFVTAGGLFRTTDGERLAPETSIAVSAGLETLLVDAADVVLSATPVVNVALLRVDVGQTELAPGLIAFEPPSPGAGFLVSGLAENRPADVPQRTRFVSSVLLVGDRDVSGLDGCLGSAARTAGSTFGVVTACEAGKTPIVTLFRAARSFLERNIPALRLPSLTEANGHQASKGPSAS
jgi:hypothetical protein